LFQVFQKEISKQTTAESKIILITTRYDMLWRDSLLGYVDFTELESDMKKRQKIILD